MLTFGLQAQWESNYVEQGAMWNLTRGLKIGDTVYVEVIKLQDGTVLVDGADFGMSTSDSARVADSIAALRTDLYRTLQQVIQSGGQYFADETWTDFVFNLSTTLLSSTYAHSGNGNHTEFRAGHVAEFRAYNGADTAHFKVNPDGTIEVQADGSGAMQYTKDFSSNYTDRSLVDKAYVDANSGGATPDSSFESIETNEVAPKSGTETDFTENILMQNAKRIYWSNTTNWIDMSGSLFRMFLGNAAVFDIDATRALFHDNLAINANALLLLDGAAGNDYLTSTGSQMRGYVAGSMMFRVGPGIFDIRADHLGMNDGELDIDGTRAQLMNEALKITLDSAIITQNFIDDETVTITIDSTHWGKRLYIDATTTITFNAASDDGVPDYARLWIHRIGGAVVDFEATGTTIENAAGDDISSSTLINTMYEFTVLPTDNQIVGYGN